MTNIRCPNCGELIEYNQQYCTCYELVKYDYVEVLNEKK